MVPRFFFLGIMVLSLLQTKIVLGQITNPVTFEKIKVFLERNPETSLDELLDNLPEEIRNNYVLMQNSRSTQGATPQKPRVILFDSNSNLQLSFSDSGEKGGNKIEILEFDKGSKKYAPKEIDFSSGTAVMNENPRTCKGCHSEDIRPNWQNYPQWDHTFGLHERKFDKYYGDGETGYIDEFLRTSYGKGRYAKLGPIPGLNDLDGPKKDIHKIVYDHQVLQNLKLTHDVSMTNVERVVRILKENYPEFMPFFMAMSMGCVFPKEDGSNLDAYLPENLIPNGIFDYNEPWTGGGALERGDSFERVLISVLNKNGIKMEHLLPNYNTGERPGHYMDFGDGTPTEKRNHSNQFGFTNPYMKISGVFNREFMKLDDFAGLGELMESKEERKATPFGTLVFEDYTKTRPGKFKETCEELGKLSKSKLRRFGIPEESCQITNFEMALGGAIVIMNLVKFGLFVASIM